ncbi:MAG: YqiA/YcfP family alpha/beta fold hydrolase [Spongiibacteraceae bacterium]
MADAIFVYFHGFLSSPRSVKAQQLVQFIDANHLSIECVVPELPEEPHRAFAVAEKAIKLACEKNPSVGILGSSLGGFYATVFAERFGLRAVLINPSVRPHLRFGKFIQADGNDLVNPYTDRRFTLDERDIDALATHAPERLTRLEKYWLLAQMGDEVIDYREAVDYYAGAKQTIEPDGDHAFQGFERYLPEIVKFLQLPLT